MTAFSIGIVHYRDPESVDHQLARIAGWQRPPEMCLVVDNSGELSQVELAGRHPNISIRLSAPGINLGYAGAANVALRESERQGLPSMLLLTQDAQIDEGIVDALRKSMEQDDRVAVVAPLLAFGSRPTVTFSRGGYLRRDGRFNHHNALDGIDGVRGRGVVDVDWVDGACLLIRVAAAIDVGLIPEEYFLYVEDVDFGLALRRRGWRVRVDTDVVAMQEPGNFTDYFRSRNLIHLLLKNRAEFAFWAAPTIAAKELVRAAQRARVKGVLWTIRGMIDAVRLRMGEPPKRLLGR